jgi:hypothetical protein
MGMMTVLWPQRLVTKPKAGKLLFFMFYHVVIISYLRFFSSVSRSCESVRRNFAGLAGTWADPRAMITPPRLYIKYVMVLQNVLLRDRSNRFFEVSDCWNQIKTVMNAPPPDVVMWCAMQCNSDGLHCEAKAVWGLASCLGYSRTRKTPKDQRVICSCESFVRQIVYDVNTCKGNKSSLEKSTDMTLFVYAHYFG